MHTNLLVLPDAMTRATSDTNYSDLLRTMADGDTIIAGADYAVSDRNQFGAANVNAVSVRAVKRSCYLHITNRHIVAIAYKHMEKHGIYRFHSFNHTVVRLVKFDGLQGPNSLRQQKTINN